MATIVPSFSAKVTRAKKHLIDLQAEIDRWEHPKPYRMRQSVEGKKKTWRIAFTSDPANTDIPNIAADAIYNLRSALDHLMSALVANRDRGGAMFPIFFQGVWEAAVPGENAQRLKDRKRWASDTKSLGAEPLALLKTMQPPDDAGDHDEANLLRFINRLSNRDRHTKLPVMFTGLYAAMFKWNLPDGTPQTAIATPTDPDGFFKDDARVPQIPEDAVDVEIAASPLIVIRVGRNKAGTDRHLEIPKELTAAARLIEEEIIPRLAPHVRPE